MTTRTVLKAAFTTAMLLTSLSSFAAGALSVDKQVTINANTATVWKMVGNFNGLDVWPPVVVGSDLKTGSNNELDAERILTRPSSSSLQPILMLTTAIHTLFSNHLCL